jgi:hypothetical protein
MDIAAWLDGLGLQQYEPVFRDNDIDSAVLPSLTAALRQPRSRRSAGGYRRVSSACRRDGPLWRVCRQVYG